jgi:hypothetical protein
MRGRARFFVIERKLKTSQPQVGVTIPAAGRHFIQFFCEDRSVR